MDDNDAYFSVFYFRQIQLLKLLSNYKAPGFSYFVVIGVILGIPVTWILFNPELRTFMWRKLRNSMIARFQLKRLNQVAPVDLS